MCAPNVYNGGQIVLLEQHFCSFPNLEILIEQAGNSKLQHKDGQWKSWPCKL